VSFLNGLAAAGAGLSAFAATAAKEDMFKGDKEASLANALSLINRTSPSTTAAATPVPATSALPLPPPSAAPAAPAAAAPAPGTKLTDLAPDLTHVVAPGGAKFTVASSAADRFTGLITDLEAAGYKIDPAISGGYNPRYIAGTQTPSEHAYGLAIDVNSVRNPQGGTTSDLPPDLARELAAKYGMVWGGDWHGKTRDPMHFQIARG
jgi:hypothetical protein